ncbi:MAG: hypothetical protein AB7N54_19965 [Alphaproteobacteria bacterium]
MALTDYQSLADDLVRDDSGRIATADRDAAIALAVTRYAKDRPRTAVEDLDSGAGGHLLDLPEGWETDFSRLVTLEYPVGAVPPALRADWRLYETPAATKIMLADALPASATVRASYTIAHVVDAETDTVPASDREAVTCWAAALLLDQLAAFHAGSTDATIKADAVAPGSKSGDYARRAAAMRKRYFDELGLDPKKAVAAGIVVDLDPRASDGGLRMRDRRWR